ncbi:hypothetical protein KQI82_12355 [Oscillibacter sp. MSJ-2]|uniref:Uncharacterized protein n=1 Tax=Dysosmobacter acutus TaxID=2841504 RepID=A0ABS6FDJ8_9FIRM|nr:hypothetical protein [Dysosmobacter acutus]MBU5627701.1 hypothetical protein [Dysosmobacter acutus]
MSYTIQIPEITSADIVANPVSINISVKLSVSVIEKTITLEPMWYYSGELYGGEV